MPLTCNLRDGNFNLTIDEEGNLHLPQHIIDLGSMIGVLISCLAKGTEFGRVLLNLNFYARFLQGLNSSINTICVVFDGRGNPFWFGSTLCSMNRDTDMYTRRRILAYTLRELQKPIILPIMPPIHQRDIGIYIRDFILRKGNQSLANNEKVAKSCVYLLQLITQKREPTDDNPRPWEIVPSVDEREYEKRVKAISSKINTDVFQRALKFEILKDSLMNPVKNCKSGQYGHCAETYPLIFMFWFVSFFLFFQIFAYPVTQAELSRFRGVQVPRVGWVGQGVLGV